MIIELIEGKVFRSADGAEFGVIRRLDDPTPIQIAEQSFEAFAEDECGNFFVQRNGSVAFWDHETNAFEPLANSQVEFMSKLVSPKPALALPGNVLSAWIDPEFLKEQNNK